MTNAQGTDGSIPEKRACPGCGSDDVARCEAVWRQGTTHTSSSTTEVGVGLTKGGVVPVMASGSSQGVQVTALAQLCAPRANPMSLAACVIGPIVLGLIAFFIVGLVWHATAGAVVWALVAVVLMVLLCRKYKRISAEVTRLNEGYERRWVCFRCNHIWDPERPGGALPTAVEPAPKLDEFGDPVPPT